MSTGEHVAVKDPASVAIRKEVTFDKMLVFSGFPETNSVHTNREFAVSLGLPDAVAQGLHTYAFMLEWLVRYFGEDWFQGGKLGVSFLSVVVPGDVVTVKSEITSTDATPEGTQVALDIWCENERGQKVAAGTASALVRN